MAYLGEVPMHCFTCIMAVPETPPLTFRAEFSCGKAIYNERRLPCRHFQTNSTETARCSRRNAGTRIGRSRIARSRAVPHRRARVAPIPQGLANL